MESGARRGASIPRYPVVVGADGYEDVSIRSRGNRNLVTYDDSNLVVGGTGDGNAQIGDSDTGGAVVMGVHGSVTPLGPASRLRRLVAEVSA